MNKNKYLNITFLDTKWLNINIKSGRIEQVQNYRHTLVVK